MTYNFITVDVFTEQALGGTSIPVVLHADGLDDKTMQAIAIEMNASDTVFLTGTANNYSLRVFTPVAEVASANHTRLAVAKVIASQNSPTNEDGVVSIRLKDLTGEHNVDVSIVAGKTGMITQSYRSHPLIDRFVPTGEEIAEMLSLIPADIGFDKFAPLIVNSQGSYLIVPIKSYKAVRAAVFNDKVWDRSSASASLVQGILLFSNNTDANAADFHARLVGPDVSKREDPPLAPLLPEFACYVAEHKHIQLGTHVMTLQRGANDARQSMLHVEMDHKKEKDMTVRIGGAAVISIKGSIEI